MKFDIGDRYIPAEEIHEDDLPYAHYLDVLEVGFDLGNDVQSACDLGCGSGLLLTNLHDRFPGLGIFALQLWYSRLWLGRFRYGRLEWCWRALSYWQ